MPVRKKRLDICGKCERAARPAITAAKLGHVNCLSTAYKDLGVFNERDDHGATLFHIACRFGRVNCVKFLLEEAECTPSDKGTSNVTGVHICAAHGKY